MSETPENPKSFHLLFLAIAAIGLILRFAQLGDLPLDDAEAREALAALGMANGQASGALSSPAYVGLTSLLFRILGSNDWLARFFPALFGTLTVLAVFPLKDSIGKRAVLILASGLAILPPFVAISRFAGGQSLLLLALLLAALALSKKKATLLGISISLFLLSGPIAISGLSIFLLTAIFSIVLPQGSPISAWLEKLRKNLQGQIESRDFLVGFLTTLLLLTTGFLTRISALGNIASGFASFIESWRISSGLPLLQFGLAFLVYAAPLLFIALLSLFLQRKILKGWHGFALLWILLSLLFLAVYPGRSAEDLVWVVLPALFLAADLLGKSIQIAEERKIAVGGAFLLLALLASFQWLNFAGLAQGQLGTELFTQRLWIAAIVPAVAALALLLIGGGWSPAVPSQAVLLFSSIGLMLVSISQSSTIGRPSEVGANALWRNAYSAAQGKLLTDSLFQLSDLNFGRNYELVVERKIESPALDWLLRDWRKEQSQAMQALGLGSDILITAETQGSPSEVSAYRGQDFVWSYETAWLDGMPSNFFDWVLFQEAPVASNKIVLWAREDLFPQAQIEDIETDAGFNE